ncbi:hypothetical protein SAMN03159507_01798 [Pseudomonas sp. NFACC32-1]|uniref:hypothetical protein n=1 Tax=Pseudomonas sp. NFACC32-1 TaxID=1566198 RepID=UPI0008766BDC|nr:hypothetical protein [Pseudomonas sp. NFACC32-1]SCX55837.1 hypothetical protein SAMN03159507_01798 [Pseudomonas sp. NFACC32-1]
MKKGLAGQDLFYANDIRGEHRTGHGGRRRRFVVETQPSNIASSHHSKGRLDHARIATRLHTPNRSGGPIVSALDSSTIGQLSTFLIISLSLLAVLGIAKALSKANRKTNPDSQVFLYGTLAVSLLIIVSATLIWDKSNLPAWLQGIGSIYAIIVAILVSRHESRNSEARSRQERADDHKREAQRLIEEKVEATRAIYQMVLRAFMCFSYVRENAYDKSLTCKDIGPRKGKPELKINAGKKWISLGFKASDIRVQLRQLEAFTQQLEKISPFDHRDAVLALLTSEFCASIKVLFADLATGWNIKSTLAPPDANADTTIKYPPCERNATYTETEKLIGLSEFLAHGIFHLYLDEPECNRIEEVFLQWEKRADEIFASGGSTTA